MKSHSNRKAMEGVEVDIILGGIKETGRRSIILMDIDHTIRSTFWRDPNIGDWDKYHQASMKDAPFKDIIEMNNLLYSGGFFVFGLTAIPEKYRSLTNQYLVHHRVFFDQLWMRPDEDKRPSPVVKVSLAKLHLGGDLSSKVAFVFDDRADVCEAFKAEGVCALQVYQRRD